MCHQHTRKHPHCMTLRRDMSRVKMMAAFTLEMQDMWILRSVSCLSARLLHLFLLWIRNIAHLK